MLVGFTCATTYAISAYHHIVVGSNPTHDEVYLIQHYVVKFVSDLLQISGFLCVLQFTPPIKLTTTDILFKVALSALTRSSFKLFSEFIK